MNYICLDFIFIRSKFYNLLSKTQLRIPWFVDSYLYLFDQMNLLVLWSLTVFPLRLWFCDIKFTVIYLALSMSLSNTLTAMN